MNWDRIIEIAVLITLWIEFAYDAWWNSRENRLKRRKQREKAQKPRSEAPVSHTPNLEPKQGTSSHIESRL